MTTTQQPPVIALKNASGPQYSPGHVLPSDHPVRRLVQLLQHEVNSDTKCKLIRALRASTAAHLKKTPTHRVLQLHAEAVRELKFLALDELAVGSFSLEALALYQEAIEYHSTWTQGPKPKVKAPKEPKAPPEPRPKVGNDEIAQLMKGLGLDEMYAMAQDKLGTPQTTLKARYGHLNPGLQAMNLRNRLRSAGGDENNAGEVRERIYREQP